MYRRFHDRFGTAGVLLGVIALILALGGTALAASGALTGKQKKEVEKIAKKFAGKSGAQGAPGAAGTNGTNGKDGSNGTPGSPGAPGKSVLTSAAQVGLGAGKCEVSGTKLEVEGSGKSEVVCNGKNGTTGFTKFLPSGQSEKGAFGATGAGGKVIAPVLEGVLAPVSFNIPLEVAPTPHVVTIAEGETTECPGGVTAPDATAGNLCVFLAREENVLGVSVSLPWAETETGKSGPEGALVLATHTGSPGSTSISGSWAVTAE